MLRFSLQTLVCLMLSFCSFSHEVTFTLAMDTDKIKIFGARVKVDGTGKLAELERAEKVSNPVLFFPSGILITTIRKK